MFETLDAHPPSPLGEALRTHRRGLRMTVARAGEVLRLTVGVVVDVEAGRKVLQTREDYVRWSRALTEAAAKDGAR